MITSHISGNHRQIFKKSKLAKKNLILFFLIMIFPTLFKLQSNSLSFEHLCILVFMVLYTGTMYLTNVLLHTLLYLFVS